MQKPGDGRGFEAPFQRGSDCLESTPGRNLANAFTVTHIPHFKRSHPRPNCPNQKTGMRNHRGRKKKGDARTRTATRGVHCRLQSILPWRCARAQNRVRHKTGREGHGWEACGATRASSLRTVPTNRFAGLDENAEELRPVPVWCGGRSRTRALERDWALPGPEEEAGLF